MGNTSLSFSQRIGRERRRWMPFRRALSTEDQEAFDRMCADAKPQVQVEVHLGRPWRFEAVLMAVLPAHEKQIERVHMRLEAVNAENYPPMPDENPPE